MVSLTIFGCSELEQNCALSGMFGVMEMGIIGEGVNTVQSISHVHIICRGYWSFRRCIVIVDMVVSNWRIIFESFGSVSKWHQAMYKMYNGSTLYTTIVHRMILAQFTQTDTCARARVCVRTCNNRSVKIQSQIDDTNKIVDDIVRNTTKIVCGRLASRKWYAWIYEKLQSMVIWVDAVFPSIWEMDHSKCEHE